MRACEAKGMEFVSPFQMCAIGRFILFDLPQTCELARRICAKNRAAKHLHVVCVRSPLLGPSRRYLSLCGQRRWGGGFNPTRTDFNCIPCRTPLETRRQWTSVRPTSSSDPMSVPSPYPYPSVPLPLSLHRSAALHNSLGRTTKRSLESPPTPPTPPIKRIYLFLSPEYEKRTDGRRQLKYAPFHPWPPSTLGPPPTPTPQVQGLTVKLGLRRWEGRLRAESGSGGRAAAL